MALNVTAVDPSGWGFFTVWPCEFADAAGRFARQLPGPGCGRAELGARARRLCRARSASGRTPLRTSWSTSTAGSDQGFEAAPPFASSTRGRGGVRPRQVGRRPDDPRRCFGQWWCTRERRLGGGVERDRGGDGRAGGSSRCGRVVRRCRSTRRHVNFVNAGRCRAELGAGAGRSDRRRVHLDRTPTRTSWSTSTVGSNRARSKVVPLIASSTRVRASGAPLGKVGCGSDVARSGVGRRGRAPPPCHGSGLERDRRRPVGLGFLHGVVVRFADAAGRVECELHQGRRGGAELGAGAGRLRRARCASGPTPHPHVLVDVNGWFTSGFEGHAPRRFVDTRSGQFAPL